jgi:hypothetical protein
LWILRDSERVGPSHGTLGLYKQSVGAFPAMFLDPATAAGFAKWLSETHATRVGEYQIGWVAPEEATAFQPTDDPGLAALVVKQWGSE